MAQRCSFASFVIRQQGNCSTSRCRIENNLFHEAGGSRSGIAPGMSAIAAETSAVKFSVHALHYDGTIAVNGIMDPTVRAAIDESRRQGIVVILATGRRMTDLHHVAGDLTCFDATSPRMGPCSTFR
jgi:hypothetical protein